MNKTFNGIIVETDGVRSIEGGGTNAYTASGALANLGGVSLSGNQTISGIKEFQTRPTVNGTGVALEGEFQNNTIISGVVYSAQVNVKNDHTGTLYKGQPVYIKGAAGGNILVGPASNTGEATSSKTLGLIYQDSLTVNASGTVITDGLLSSFDVGLASAGDPIWLGPTGNLIYGLINKPVAPNHLVYLGVVTRTNNNGEVFVKVQNGFELDELHDVGVKNSLTGQILFKDSTNQWIGKNLEISNISGLQPALDSKQVTGNYYLASNPSGFITSGSINLLNYIAKSGDTMSGKLIAAADATSSKLNIGSSIGVSTPSSFTGGDLWINNGNKFSWAVGASAYQAAAINQTNSFSWPQTINTNSTSSLLTVTNTNSAAGSAAIFIASGTSSAVRITQLGSGESFRVEDSTNPDSSPFVIDANGNVGIGTTSPSSLLDVSGLSLFSQRPIINGTGVLLNGEINTGLFYLNTNPSGYINSTSLVNFVSTTGSQIISGSKIFASPPLETKSTPSISASSLSLNLSSGSLFYVNLNSSITGISLINIPASPSVHSFTLQFVADGTARTVAWPASFRWAASTPPTLTSTLNKVDTFTFLTHDGGTNWFAYTSNQNQ